MNSAQEYFPGALSGFLMGKKYDEGVVSGTRKRRKHNEVGNVLFKKLAKSKLVDLPVGEKHLQQTFNESDHSYMVKSGTSLANRRFRKKNKRKKNDEKLTAEEKARTLFVGNAPLMSTRKDIKKLFSKFGTIESVRLRSVIANDEKTSKKVAVLKHALSNKMKSLIFYVKFKDTSSVQDALAMNGEKFGDNLLRVDSCCAQRMYSCRTTVFVGNLPFDVSENELIAHFETTGSISFVRIVRDSKTGIGKGFAFVAFKESAAVSLALQLDGSTFKKRQLRVMKVQKKNKRKAGTNVQKVTRPRKEVKRGKMTNSGPTLPLSSRRDRGGKFSNSYKREQKKTVMT